MSMRLLYDIHGLAIRLTEERLAHILEHQEMVELEGDIEEALRQPEQIVESLSDPQTLLYYRFYVGTRVGDKFLCVVSRCGSPTLSSLLPTSPTRSRKE
jgi:hypothetical protein